MRYEWLKMGSVMFPSSNRARMNGLPDLGVGSGVSVRRGLFWGQALFVPLNPQNCNLSYLNFRFSHQVLIAYWVYGQGERAHPMLHEALMCPI